MKVALVQQAAPKRPQTPFEESVAGIREAAGAGARLVLLQELHGHRYFPRVEDPRCFELAETVPGPTTDTLAPLARELGVVIVCSVFEQRAAGLYHNTAVVLDADGRIAGRYRKMHIPHDPGYFEKFYFAPGDLDFTPIDTAVGRLGVLLCWDQWYPEAARLMALAGAQLLLYPTAIGWSVQDSQAERRRQREAWQLVQRGHAVANQLPLLCCNRVGREGDGPQPRHAIQFWGSSFVCGPQGELLGEAPSDRETVLLARIDLQRGAKLRVAWPFLRDRRIDAYSGLLARYRDRNLDPQSGL